MEGAAEAFWISLVAWIGDKVPRIGVGKEEEKEKDKEKEKKGPASHSVKEKKKKMVSASKEMAVYCFDTLVSHYTGDVVPAPGFEEGQL